MRSERHKSGFGGRAATVVLVSLIAVVLGFGLGFLLGLRGEPAYPGAAGKPAEGAAAETTSWTCSMHPQIQLPQAGKCPICFMDLIPVAVGAEEVGEREISFSEAALKLMEVETTPVERKSVSAEVRVVGKIDYDETRVKHITSWVRGRIDRLYVDFTGITVRKGDHMVYLYSPALLSAQEELLQASKAAANLEGGSELIAESVRATLEATREKLRLLGLTEEQIEQIEKTGGPVDQAGR